MTRIGIVLFGLAAYAIFLATFLYLIAFVAGMPAIPRSLDHPQTSAPTAVAVCVDLALVTVFGLQHSLMARTGFKTAWTRIIAAPIERSAYMIFACLALVLLFALWQPVPGTLWDARGTMAEPLLWALFAAGWLFVLLSTLMISHFELFGLAQVWRHWRAKPAAAPTFRTPFFYKLVRHPLYSGFLVAFWATPSMSYGHLLFAATMTIYVLVAVEYEERDLVRLFGTDYEGYRTKVGKLAPRFRATSE